MADASNKFTEQKLKVFYANVLGHYKHCMDRQMDIQTTYNEMFANAQFAIESPLGSLASLSQSEKIKAYQAFNALFYALYDHVPSYDKPNFKACRPNFVVNQIHHYHHPYHYSYTDNLMTWILLSNLMSHRHYPSGGGVFGHSGTTHTHPNGSGGSSNQSHNKALAILAVIAVVAFAASLAFIALFYMINQMADGFERFWHNEGWLKASLLFATSIGFGAVSALLAVNFATSPLIALAIAAGLNPIGLVLFGIISLSLIGAGLASFVTALITDSVSQKKNADAMDPLDAKRFSLSAVEELALVNRNIDPIKVKCAIVALRVEIASQLGNDKAIPSFFSRHYGSSKRIQPLLDQVRELRKGILHNGKITVGNMTFDCRIPHHYNMYSHAPAVSSDGYPPAYSDYLKDSVLPEGFDVPSAPPVDDNYECNTMVA